MNVVIGESEYRALDCDHPAERIHESVCLKCGEIITVSGYCDACDTRFIDVFDHSLGCPRAETDPEWIKAERKARAYKTRRAPLPPTAESGRGENCQP